MTVMDVLKILLPLFRGDEAMLVLEWSVTVADSEKLTDLSVS